MNDNPNHPYPKEGYLLLSPKVITEIAEGQIFVFGSNNHGRHGKGAAKFALHKFGALHGVAEGLQGRSYGLPTVKCAPYGPFQGSKMSLDEILIHVRRFLEYARTHDGMTFLLTEVACGLGGHQAPEIARLFWKDMGGIPLNVHMPRAFVENGPPHQINTSSGQEIAIRENSRPDNPWDQANSTR